MHPRLSTFQDHLATALRPGQAHVPGNAWLSALAAQPGFSVYRNTITQGCLDALRANYPTVRQLVGDDCFDGAALAFMQRSPPTDGRLLRYGKGFATHLARWAPTAALPYLPDIARLDRYWCESHCAADAAMADPATLAAHTPEALGRLCLRPHPAARWLWCDAHPAYTLWQRHREGQPLDTPLAWRGEGALLTRPEAAVHWCAIDAAGCTFLAQCARGLPLGDAATATLHAHPDTDLSTLLAELLRAGALTSDHTHA